MGLLDQFQGPLANWARANRYGLMGFSGNVDGEARNFAQALKPAFKGFAEAGQLDTQAGLLAAQEAERQAGIQQTAQTLSQTQQWLDSLAPTNPQIGQIAQGLRMGAIEPSDAFNSALGILNPAGQEPRIEEVDGHLVQINADGTTQTLWGAPQEPGYTQLTPQEVTSIPGLDPTRAYQRGPDGKIYEIGGGGVNVSVGGGEVGTIPTGYELFTDPTSGARSLRAIPGGPVEQEEQQAVASRDAARRAADDQTAVVVNAIETALGQSNFFNTGLVGRGTRAVGLTPGVELDSTIATVKANIGFDELQAMREASPTGGALGQVAVQELTMLQAVSGSLDTAQGEGRLDEVLLQIRNLTMRNKIYRDLDAAGIPLDDPRAQQLLSQFPLPQISGMPTLPLESDGMSIYERYGLEPPQ